MEKRPIYINTGYFSNKAVKEVPLAGKSVKVIASSEDKNFSYIPRNISVDKDAAYVHMTSNNTIEGTQWQVFPDTGKVPLIADMSSDFMSRPFDPAPFGMIYAGAQKNIGPAGVCLAIIRNDMLERSPASCRPCCLIKPLFPATRCTTPPPVSRYIWYSSY
jgi:phosphoserine aminotransferase